MVRIGMTLEISLIGISIFVVFWSSARVNFKSSSKHCPLKTAIPNEKNEPFQTLASASCWFVCKILSDISAWDYLRCTWAWVRTCFPVYCAVRMPATTKWCQKERERSTSPPKTLIILAIQASGLSWKLLCASPDSYLEWSHFHKGSCVFIFQIQEWKA